MFIFSAEIDRWMMIMTMILLVSCVKSAVVKFKVVCLPGEHSPLGEGSLYWPTDSSPNDISPSWRFPLLHIMAIKLHLPH